MIGSLIKGGGSKVSEIIQGEIQFDIWVGEIVWVGKKVHLCKCLEYWLDSKYQIEDLEWAEG